MNDRTFRIGQQEYRLVFPIGPDGTFTRLDATTAVAIVNELERLQKPVDMVMHCPKCGLQHIDRRDCVHDHFDVPCRNMTPPDEYERRIAEMLEWERTHTWDNPPHKSHLCRKEDGGCGFIWRPSATHFTNGVQAVEPGKNDSPVLPPLGATGVDIRLGRQMYVDYSQHYRNGTIQLTIKRQAR